MFFSSWPLCEVLTYVCVGAQVQWGDNLTHMKQSVKHIQQAHSKLKGIVMFMLRENAFSVGSGWVGDMRTTFKTQILADANFNWKKARQLWRTGMWFIFHLVTQHNAVLKLKYIRSLYDRFTVVCILCEDSARCVHLIFSSCLVK